MVAALPQTVERAGLSVGEDAGAIHNFGEFRMCNRNLDDVDPETGRVGVGGIRSHASGQFFVLANSAGARDVDVDIVLVLRIQDEGVSVGTTAALDCGYLFRISEVTDIEDANATET